MADAEETKVVPLRATATTRTTATVIADSRYSFTAQYVLGAAMFARGSAKIEHEHPDTVDDTARIEHRAFVTAAIMQCAAAVEAESAELTIHGPGSHLGSNGLDKGAHLLLVPKAEFIDKQDSLERYGIILHLLDKPPMPKGEWPWQEMAVLIKLRNELIHYKSKWARRWAKHSPSKRSNTFVWRSRPSCRKVTTSFRTGYLERLARLGPYVRPWHLSVNFTIIWELKARFDHTRSISKDCEGDTEPNDRGIGYGVVPSSC